MRWNDKRLYGVASLALILGGCGADAARGERPDRAAPDPVMAPDVAPILGEPYSIGDQKFEPKDDNAFDEVGYSITLTPDNFPTATITGEAYNPNAIVVSHRILSVPSYVELTNLETGKTILARVVDRGPKLKDRTVGLSPATANLLGVTGAAPVRVRRLNPPISEKMALRSGRPASDRLDTPPSLLSALKRRLVESGMPKPSDVVMTPPAPKPANPLLVKKQTPTVPAKPTKAAPKAPGADFGAAPPAPQPAPPAAKAPGRFGVEGGQKPTATSPKASASAATASSLYVQIAALSDGSRAQALAKKAGGTAVQVGTIWRVRYGPFASQADAQAALSEARRKGYRDARISR